MVTIDGKPYKDAVVSFQPIGSRENPNPGRGSTGVTDENGRFELKSDGGQGALVGKQRVRIATRNELLMARLEGWDYSKGPPEGGDLKGKKLSKARPEPIPPEWWDEKSTKEFDVPPGGTDQANFHIVTKKK